MDCESCIDNFDFSVKVVSITTKCKYHKRIGQVYNSSKVAPLGLCRELFYATYPASLAVLYSGKPRKGWLRKKGIRRLKVGCPASRGVKVEVRVEEMLFSPLLILKELAEELCKVVYHPMDGPFRRVVIEIIEVGSDCSKGYSVGDKFNFNINSQDALCPAGFSAVYPFLRLMNNSKKEEGITESVQVHCPDWAGVTYEVKF